jgi:hypothetical protein
MPEVMFALPILPGKTQAARDMYKVMEGKRKELDAVSVRHGVKKETWFIQSSPQGDFMLGYLEVDDLQKAFMSFATDQDPVVVWSREKLKEVTGVDFAQPQQAPPPQQVWRQGY